MKGGGSDAGIKNALAGVQSRVREVSARVQSGILTHQESYAIEAARSAGTRLRRGGE